MPKGGGGGLPAHVAAGANKSIGKKERYLLRTGKAPGKSGKAERKILAMREEAELRRKREAGQSSAGAASSTSASEFSAAAPADEVTLYRRLKAQEQEKEDQAAAAKNVATPAAASFLSSLRAEMRVEKKESEPS